ncbi:hypothetical protein [Breoghania sp.]|uniref:hypothetical protein n=1 Tax=Breoghania sp. TaxID=2065378 RepID=UPI0029C9EB8C|nr:hypothetical protein [Breoghania sp.]
MLVEDDGGAMVARIAQVDVGIWTATEAGDADRVYQIYLDPVAASPSQPLQHGRLQIRVPALALTIATDEALSRPYAAATVLLAGSLNRGRLAGQLRVALPRESGTAPKVFFLDALQCSARWPSARLQIEVMRDGKPYPADVEISDGRFRRSWKGITRLDEIVPSYATYRLRWSLPADTGATGAAGVPRMVTDIIPRLIIAPGDVARLTVNPFDPAGMKPVAPVMLASENGSKTEVSYTREVSPDGSVALQVDISGRPGSFVMLDSLSGVAGATRDGQDQRDGFTSPLGPLQASCNVKGGPPGVAGNLKQAPATNVPGGAGGAPPDPDNGGTGGSGGGGGGGPCSSTADNNTCDQNYCAIIPPSGKLTLKARATPIPTGQREIALGAFLHNGASQIPQQVVLHKGLDGPAVEDRILPAGPFIVERGTYVLRVPVGAGGRPSYDLPIAIDAANRRITQVQVDAPTLAQLMNEGVQLVADVRLGQAARVIDSYRLPDALVAETLADDTGWLAACAPKGAAIREVKQAPVGGGGATLPEPKASLVRFEAGGLACATVAVPNGHVLSTFVLQAQP